MQETLIYTKVTIPSIPGDRLSRVRLTDRLASVPEDRNPLILLSSSAGSGKTVLLSDWARINKTPVAWLSLDTQDNDPVRFWLYIIFSLRQILPDFGTDLFHALHKTEKEETEDIIRQLVNLIYLHGEMISLVLDDYHIIKSLEIHKGMSDFLFYLPGNCRLILTSREDPPFSLSELRARNKLIELRFADFCFNRSETREYLSRVFNLSLDQEEVDILYSRTEGWPVGLQMTALNLLAMNKEKRKSFLAEFMGRDRNIVDYLMETLLYKMPGDEYKFLVETSILNVLEPGVCNAVTKRADSLDVLIRLHKNNCFLSSLDASGEKYRYHHLFRDILRYRLNMEYADNSLIDLFQRAVSFYEEENSIITALETAEQAEDPDFLASVLQHHILEFFYRSEIHTVTAWLEKIPDTIKKKYPLISAVNAGCILLNESRGNGVPPATEFSVRLWADRSRKRYEEKTLEKESLTLADTRALLFCDKILTYLYKFKEEAPEDIIRICEETLQKIPPEETLFRSSLYANMGENALRLNNTDKAEEFLRQSIQTGIVCGDTFNIAASFSGLALLDKNEGKLFQALDLCRQGLECVRQISGYDIPYSGTIYVRRGEILALQGQFKEAQESINKGLNLLRFSRGEIMMQYAHLLMAQISFCLGDRDEESIQLKAVNRYPETVGSQIQMIIKTYKAVTLGEISPEDTDVALAWMVSGLPQDNSLKKKRLTSLTAIKILILEGKTDDRVIEYLTNQLVKRNVPPPVRIEILKNLALCCQVRGDSKKAEGYMRQALLAGEKENFCLPFLFECREIRNLLQEMSGNHESRGQIRDIFKSVQLPSVLQEESALREETVNELSPREKELLSLITKGLSNQEISDTLFISMSTVKTHINHIYSKLNVENRSRAIIKASKLFA